MCYDYACIEMSLLCVSTNESLPAGMYETLDLLTDIPLETFPIICAIS